MDKDTIQVTLGHIIGHMMSAGPVISDVKLDHLVKVVSARLLSIL